MEEAIVKSKEIFENELDYVIDMYDQSFIYTSERTSRETGYSVEELSKIKISEMIPDDMKEKYRDEVMNRLAEGHNRKKIIRKHKNGKNFEVDIEFEIFELEGGWWLAGKIYGSKLIE